MSPPTTHDENQPEVQQVPKFPCFGSCGDSYEREQMALYDIDEGEWLCACCEAWAVGHGCGCHASCALPNCGAMISLVDTRGVHVSDSHLSGASLVCWKCIYKHGYER